MDSYKTQLTLNMERDSGVQVKKQVNSYQSFTGGIATLIIYIFLVLYTASAIKSTFSSSSDLVEVTHYTKDHIDDIDLKKYLLTYHEHIETLGLSGKS
jgi:hypothetical protein